MKKFLTLLCAMSFVWVSICAVPALRKPRTFTQTDGTTITVTLRGDESSHCYVTDDGLALVRQANGDFCYRTKDGSTGVVAHNAANRSAEEVAFVNAQAGQLNAASVRNSIRTLSKRAPKSAVVNESQVPHIGSPKVPILLVQYSDVKFKDSDPKAIFENEMNGTGKSVKEYFKSQSFDKFTPEFDVLGPVTLSNNRKYYGANDSYGDDVRPGEMIKEACDKIDATVNFADYDNDKDGYVDVVYVIYAGVGEASDDNADDSVWPHQWSLSETIGSTATYDGVKVDKYGCSNELYNGAIDGIGGFCHEFSHCLGLPDFYDTSGVTENYGMDSWSLMDYGSYCDYGYTPCAYTAYEREFMGWLDIETLYTKATGVELNTIDNGGKAYRVQSPYNSNEYYILENRQNTGWDTYIESHGLMITHVDYDEQAWYNNTVNNITSHRRMTIIPADNKLADTNNSGDLYPNGGSNTELTDESTPAAKLFTGGYMGQPITDIAENGGKITFNFNDTKQAPELIDPIDVSSTSFTAQWGAVEDAVSYTLKVKKASDNSGEVLLSEDFAKFTLNTSDLGAKLDTYMNNAGWEGSAVYGEAKAARLGSSKKIGSLLSPYVDLTGSNGVITVAIKSKAYGSDTGVTLEVGLADDNSDLLIDEAVMNVDATEALQYVVLEGGSDANYIQMATGAVKKRAIVSEITFYAGDAGDALKTKGYKKINAVKNATPSAKSASKKSVAMLETEVEKVYTGITDTKYAVTDLEEGGTYRYQVKSVYADGESSYSTAKSITLVSSGVENASISKQLSIEGNRVTINSDAPSAVYSVAGVTIQESENNSYVLDGGVYIVKIGAEAFKIMVK